MMPALLLRDLTSLVVVTALSWPAQAAPNSNNQPRTPLRIMVVAGEDAVNIVQQQTAIAPVVEVRDENDLPVAGILVRFSVRGGGATFPGGTTASVTTNAAGRATVLAYRPTAPGAVRIDVVATTEEGQAATATITQTNYATTAQATRAGRGSTGGSGASAGAAGTAAGATAGAVAGGGGLSVTTIGLIAGGAALGGVGIAAAARSGNADRQPSPPQTLAVTGPFSFDAPYTMTVTDGGSCVEPRTVVGTLRFNLQVQSSGAVTGTMDVASTTTHGGPTCSSLGAGATQATSAIPAFSAPVAGTAASLTAVHAADSSSGGATSNYRFTFAGTLDGGVVTGTLSLEATGSAPGLGLLLGTQRGSTTITAR